MGIMRDKTGRAWHWPHACLVLAVPILKNVLVIIQQKDSLFYFIENSESGSSFLLIKLND